MTIGVVILNWNGIELLKQFLPSVIKFSPEATIYIADNASTDDSVAYVEKHHPEVKVIINGTNGGYAKGYNEALQFINEDIYILLNSDVEVTPNWLIPVKSIFENNTNIAAVQPKILDYKNRDFFEYAGAAGGFIDAFGYPYCRGRIFDTLERDIGQYDNEQEIFWASGACMAVRRKSFEQAYGFDEDYFAHQEEIDLCWRLKNMGNKIFYTHKSTVYHIGGATLSSMNPKKTFLNFRNSLFNLVKNVPSKQLFWVVFGRMILDGVAGIKFLIALEFKHLIAILQAHLYFYKALPNLLKKRKKTSNKVVYFSKFSVVCKRYIKGKKIFSDL